MQALREKYQLGTDDCGMWRGRNVCISPSSRTWMDFMMRGELFDLTVWHHPDSVQTMRRLYASDLDAQMLNFKGEHYKTILNGTLED